jgi:hypothetical protein
MSESRKKPGVAFCATVVVVALAAYPLSWGPTCRILWGMGMPLWGREWYLTIYSPLLWIYEQSPPSIQHAVQWYCGLLIS